LGLRGVTNPNKNRIAASNSSASVPQEAEGVANRSRLLQPTCPQEPGRPGGRIGHGAATARGGGAGGPGRFGGGAAGPGARDGAGVLAARLRRPPQLLPRLQVSCPLPRLSFSPRARGGRRNAPVPWPFVLGVSVLLERFILIL